MTLLSPPSTTATTTALAQVPAFNNRNRSNKTRMRKSIRRKRQTSLLLSVSAAALLSSATVHSFVLLSPSQHTAMRTSLFAESSMGRTWQQRQPERDFESQQQERGNGRPFAANTKKKTIMKPMPIKGYDASAILEYYDKAPLEVGWRLNSLGLPLLGWFLALLGDKYVFRNDDNEQVQRQRGAELRQHLVRSKSVALIKSGQALSLRPDLIRNKVWAEELGKLVDAVGAFSDETAMSIISKELSPDLLPRLKAAGLAAKPRRVKSASKLQSQIRKDPILRLFEFYNDGRSVASASIGQVYKARVKRGAALEAAIGPAAAAKWGGKLVAIKVQRSDAQASASLDMYLIRRAAMWLSMFRGGDLPAIADQFGMQLFGELDYVREANNCDRFRELYNGWSDVQVPEACNSLTRRKVLVMEWIDGVKGPWPAETGIKMVRTGLKCSVNQLMSTGLFHADPHRGNLLMTPDEKLAFIDFGMMADVSEEDRYGLVGLVIGLQNKDLPLITENLLKLGFLSDTTQLDLLVPRLRSALKIATGGTGKASDVNFASLQAQLDEISRENVLQFSTPPFFTIIIRSLTILEGMALSVDPNFRLVRGSYPYVLRQLLAPESMNAQQKTPAALQSLLVRLLTVNGEEKEIEWARLRDLLKLASKASKSYIPATDDENNDKKAVSRQTIELFFKFLTSRTGIFLKKPLVHELAEAIDGMASMGEASLLRMTRLPPLPGMNGPVNPRRMEEMQLLLTTFQTALQEQQTGPGATVAGNLRIDALMELVREAMVLFNDESMRQNAGPILAEIQSVIQLVAVEVLEIRGSRAMRSVLQLAAA